MSGKLKISESLIVCADFIKSAETARPDVVVNSLLDLALQLVRATCLPGTDEETITVLAVYTATQVLERSEVNLEKMISDAEYEAAHAEDIARSGGTLQ